MLTYGTPFITEYMTLYLLIILALILCDFYYSAFLALIV